MALEAETEIIFPNQSHLLTNGSVLNVSLYQEDYGNLVQRDPLTILVPVTIVYTIIFLTGIIGNISTCIVISKNRCMHTATNYYLFSLAISDLLLLTSGLPPEVFHMWSPWVYVFGETFCFLQGLAAETSVNASVLTITAFTIERYVAICFPFLSHTMSKLSRAIKFVIGIWILSVCLALPQAIQFGVVYDQITNGEIIQSRCTIKWVLMQHVFAISTFVIFVGPMTVITVLYILIGVKLRRSRVLTVKRPSNNSMVNGEQASVARGRSSKLSTSQNHVIRMLVAVVVAFFICWAPFHGQRLLAVYITSTMSATNPPDPVLVQIYSVLNYISGVLYFLSTTINPVLYNIMSNKFRDAFKSTLAQLCDRRSRANSNVGGLSRRPTYSALSRGNQHSLRGNLPHCVMSEPQIPPSPYNRPPIHEEARNASDGSGSATKDEFWIQMHKTPSAHNVRNSTNNIYTTSLTRENKIRQYRGFRSRLASDTSSHGTVMTTISKFGGNENDTNLKRSTSFGIPISHVVVKKKSNGRHRQKPHLHPVSFGTIAQKLGLMFKPSSSGFTEDASDKDLKHYAGQESLESGNTISNSSLQDLDETEYSSSDLVKFMGELNENIT